MLGFCFHRVYWRLYELGKFVFHNYHTKNGGTLDRCCVHAFGIHSCGCLSLHPHFTHMRCVYSSFMSAMKSGSFMSSRVFSFS